MVRSHLLGMLQNRLIFKKRQFTRDVVRRIIICSIYVLCLNGKTLIRHLAILCGIHLRHRFNRFGINTTWGELSSEWGELSSECGASCLGRVFF